MKKTVSRILIILACVICFVVGMVVPEVLRRLPDKNATGLEKIDTVYSLLKRDWYYSDKVPNVDELLSEQALLGMTTLEKDPHTNYFNLEQAKAFSQSLSGSQAGIGFGFYVQEDGNFCIRDVYVNSVADKVGLRKGDIITVVGNHVCSKTSSEKIISYIQDNEGKELTIHYLRDGKMKQVKATPATFDSSVVCKIEKEYGEVALSNFSENSGKDFAQAIQRLKDHDIKYLLLDLRGNTGGYLSAALDISSTLLPKESVVFKEKEKNGKIKENKVSGNYDYVPFKKIVVLQDENTASASEVLIGALKDNLKDVVTTVGTTSYGKGTEQVTREFKDGTSIKYTVAEWVTPSGISINKKGFEPDIKVEESGIRNVYYSELKKEDKIQPDSVHPNAEAVQKFLKYLGYDVDREDEYFSVQSAKSLKQFQKENQLKETGVVNQKTWNVLRDKVLLKANENEEKEDLSKKKAITLF